MARAKTKLLSVTAVSSSMSENAYTQPLVSSNGFSEKLTQAKSKINGLEAKLLGDTSEDREGRAERISGALEGVGNGLVGMVGGIKSGNWIQGVQGALGIVTSIVALAGPIGMIASSILSMISSLFSLFGGSQSESQESMIKRVVETAISEFRDKDMKENIEGAKQVYQSLSSSIQNFRERKNYTSVSQAEELYNHIFSGLPVFGVLKTRIAEKCEKPSKDKNKARNCLNFVKLYAELSILRQLILTDMASLLSEMAETDGQESLEATGNNILHMIKKEQESDKTVFAPFADPLNQMYKRYTIAILFSSVEEYAVLNAYMNTLHQMRDGLKVAEDANTDGGAIFRDYVLGCIDPMLQGTCAKFETKEYSNLADIEMDRRISSVFIPKGRSLTAGRARSTDAAVGPFIGPVVHGQVLMDDLWTSLTVSTTTDSIDKYVRVCEKEGMDATGRCDYIKNTQRTQEFVLSSGIHGSGSWSNKITSMYVPAGKMVLGYVADTKWARGPYYGPQLYNKTDLKGRCFRDRRNRDTLDQIPVVCKVKDKVKSLKIPGGKQVTGFSKEEYTGQVYGPYIGPATINQVDGSSNWESYKIEDTVANADDKKAAKRFHPQHRREIGIDELEISSS
eukprot:gene673-1340_t